MGSPTAGAASDGASAIELALRRKPEVVIMDVRMPGMDGLEATKMLSEQAPDSKVLIFTAYSERSLLGRGFEYGAKGYVLKEAPHSTLVRAIEKVAEGMSNADVASKLFISQETVKSHVRHILTKLEADTRTHAVAIALREAIID